MSVAREKSARIELVAPAGNLQKLKVAIAFGADAVYLSGQTLSLRAQAQNFTPSQMAEAITYAHERGVRAYVLLNVIPHNEQLAEISDQLETISGLEPDAFVVADAGAFELVREQAPDVSIHISTQANITNWRTARAWERMGAARIILARELSLQEIAEIASRVSLDLEMFVHGAMCMAYSGRCFMSAHLLGRDSNLGDCAQPCRWTYRVVEENRPNQPFAVEQSPQGTLIFSSRDLCMIEHVPDVISAGVRAFKIEGRMKSAYYVGLVTRAYRRAIDAYHALPADYRVDPAWRADVRKTSNRDFTTGFCLGDMQAGRTPTGGGDRSTTHAFVGLVTDVVDGRATVEVRGRIRKGDVLECIQPDGKDINYAVASIIDADGASLEAAHANQVVCLPDLDARPFSLLSRAEL
jgi:putative protease